jgi:hypothetical protein
MIFSLQNVFLFSLAILLIMSSLPAYSSDLPPPIEKVKSRKHVFVIFCLRDLLVAKAPSDEWATNNDWYFDVGIKDTKAMISFRDLKVPEIQETRSNWALSTHQTLDSLTFCKGDDKWFDKSPDKNLTVIAGGFEADAFKTEQLGNTSVTIPLSALPFYQQYHSWLEGRNAEYHYKVLFTVTLKY